MSEANFVIQVRVNQKWSTAHGLSSEQSLRKFLPRLMAEHGDIIRALQASRDNRTGRTKWSVYKYAKERPSRDFSAVHRRVNPCNIIGTSADNNIELNGYDSIHDDQILPDSPPEERYEVADQETPTKPRALAVYSRRLAILGSNIGRWILRGLLRSMIILARTFWTRILAPVVKGFWSLVILSRRLAATENKLEHIRSFAAGVLNTADEFSHRPAIQWSICGALASAGILAAFFASVPGGLTVAVMAGCLFLPVRRYILIRSEGNLSQVAKASFVVLLLVASGTVDLANPGRRITNRNIDYFQTHQEEILARAQSSLDEGDHLAVVTQLGKFLPAVNDEVHFLYTQARPFADVELARQAKIEDQFSFNGSNKHLTDHIIRTMTDPGSYQHVKTSYQVEGDYLEVETTFRGLNEVGELYTKDVRALLDFDGRVIHQR